MVTLKTPTAMIEHTHKKCTGCGEVKPLKAYFKASKPNRKDGRQSRCKTCYRAYYSNNVEGKEGFYSSDETRRLYGWERRYSWHIPDVKTMEEVDLNRIMKRR